MGVETMKNKCDKSEYFDANAAHDAEFVNPAYAMLTNGTMVICCDATMTTCAKCKWVDDCVTAGNDDDDTVTLTTGQTVTCPDVLDVPCWSCEHLTVCPKCEHGDDETERHLSRYIINRNKRTGQTWVVTRRYTLSYRRAIITSDGVDVRIYYRPKRFRRTACWVRA